MGSEEEEEEEEEQMFHLGLSQAQVYIALS